MAQFIIAVCPSHVRNIKLFLRRRNETHSVCSQEVCSLSFPRLFHVLPTTNSSPIFSAGEEDGYLHWQYHRCYSEGHGCRIRRFFQFCGSFCLSVHHHPIGQQGFPNSPGSAVQQPCGQVLRYMVYLLFIVNHGCTRMYLGLQSKSFSAQQCCITLGEKWRGGPGFSPTLLLKWIWTDTIAFCCCFGSAGGWKRRVRAASFFVFHACITYSSLCLVWWVPWCIEFQHKNLENVIKKYWFSFMFPTHLMQGRINHSSNHIRPNISAHAKTPLRQFQKNQLVLGHN